MKSVPLFLFVLLAHAAVVFADIPQRYEVHRIDMAANGPSEYTYPGYLNNRGRIAGNGVRYLDAPPHLELSGTYVWRSPDRYDVFAISPGRFLGVLGFNDRSVMVGYPSEEYAGYFVPMTPIVAMPHRGGYRYHELQLPVSNDCQDCQVEIASLNDRNMIVGAVSTDPDGPYQFGTLTRPYLWTSPAAAPQVVPGLETACGYPHKINDRGTVLGVFRIYEKLPEVCDFGPEGYSSYMIADGSLSQVPVPATAEGAVWSFLNNRGEVLGATTDQYGAAQRLAYSYNGKSEEIVLPIALPTYFPRGFTNHGMTVIRAHNYPAGNEGGTYVYDLRSGQIADINDLIDGAITQSFPVTINDRNQILVWGSYNGETGAYLLTPRP